jgi:hypothetical protein
MSNKKWVLDNTINKKNLYILMILKNHCPIYAKHMFEDNRVVEAFYMSDKGGIDPFDMPICKECLKPGVRVEDPAFNKMPHQYNENGELIERVNCWCDNHGITYDTKDLRHYLIEDLKLNPEIIMRMDLALYGEGGLLK